MFETLTKGFRTAKQRFQGLAELDETTVDEALKDVRTALLEADVGFDVAQDFCKRGRDKGVGVILKVRAASSSRSRRRRRRRSVASPPKTTSSSYATTSWST